MKEKDVMTMFGFGLGWKLGPYIFVIVLFFKKIFLSKFSKIHFAKIFYFKVCLH